MTKIQKTAFLDPPLDGVYHECRSLDLHSVLLVGKHKKAINSEIIDGNDRSSFLVKEKSTAMKRVRSGKPSNSQEVNIWRGYIGYGKWWVENGCEGYPQFMQSHKFNICIGANFTFIPVEVIYENLNPATHSPGVHFRRQHPLNFPWEKIWQKKIKQFVGFFLFFIKKNRKLVLVGMERLKRPSRREKLSALTNEWLD